VDLLVDDLAPLAAREGIGAAVAFADRLRERFASSAKRVLLGCSAECSAELLSRVEAVVDTDAAATAAVKRLSRDDPTTFGYVRRHWAEARRGIEACD
ncbi:hypothetical protein EXE43_26585, partial [Halorubrum sp. SS5]